MSSAQIVDDLLNKTGYSDFHNFGTIELVLKGLQNETKTLIGHFSCHYHFNPNCDFRGVGNPKNQLRCPGDSQAFTK